MNRFLTLIAVIVAQAIPVTAESREKDLDQWLDKDLIPHVRQQLVAHPRFKGETVMFVVLKDNAPAPVSNALAISLRDRMLDAAIKTPGISVGWQQGRTPAATTLPGIDCTRDEVHYYIGLELSQNLDSSYTVQVRALDLDDRSWVAGFGRSWQGSLGTVQRQALRQPRTDATFRGSRDVPFSLAETDLLAAQLAHELACDLLAQTGGDYVVAPADPASPAGALAGAVELVGNNLAQHEAIELTSDTTGGNAALRGKAHRIDGDLFQYWLTVTPAAGAEGLSTLSASSYVLLPGWPAGEPRIPTAASGPVPASGAALPQPAVIRVSIPNAGEQALLGPLRIAAASGAADCFDAGRSQPSGFQPWRAPCSLLSAEPGADAIVFFLAYQANLGLVRLGGSECRERTVARVARAGQPLRFAIPRTNAGVGSKETFDWLVEPDRDTYYAVAMTDARAARSIANHIDRLPLRCTEAAKPGLEGAALREWLDEFAALAAASHRHFDWRALAVRDVL